MTIGMGRRTRLAAVCVLIAFLPFAREAAQRYSVFNAVAAGARHGQGAVPAAPDDELEVPAANNFASVEFVNRSSCYAGCEQEDPDAVGGYGRCPNPSRKVRPQSSGRGLYILAQPDVVTAVRNGSRMRVSLVNQTDKLLAFAACDSGLAIVQEAQDTDGIWKPIETLPASHCGNSYHRVFLAQNHFWAFSAPRYKGTIPTKLRFAMTLTDGSKLYSNVFDGSINPSQFTSKPR